MAGTVRRLHTRYRLSPRAVASGALARLERATVEELPPALGARLDEALAGDPSVYVIRRVEARVAFGAAGIADDRTAVRVWSDEVARSVLRRVAEQDDDVRTYPSDAAYVAAFLGDLVDGRAWDRWYYGSFGRYRLGSTSAVVQRVLEDHHAILRVILRELRRSGALSRVLAVLDAMTLERLFGSSDLSARAAQDTIASLAVRVAARLGVATAAVDSETDRDADGPPLDWGDPRSTASAVLDALIAAWGEDVLRHALDRPDARVVLADATAELAWLDRAWLVDRLLDLVGSDPSGPDPSWLTPPPRIGNVLDELAAAHRRIDDELGPGASAGEIAARLAAALVDAEDSGWPDEAVVLRLAWAWAQVWSVIPRPGNGVHGPSHIVNGHTEVRLPAFPIVATDPDTARAIRILGPEAVERLLDQRAAGEAREASTSMASPVLGAALLLRVIAEVRLTGTFADLRWATVVPAGDPSPAAAALAALVHAWAGPHVLRIDPALAILTGLDPRFAGAPLADLWLGATPGDLEPIARRCWLTIARQRVLDRSTLRVARLTVDGRSLLVGGDPARGIVPVGRWVDDERDARSAIETWTDWWTMDMGVRPTLEEVAADDVAPLALRAAIPTPDQRADDPMLLVDLLAVSLLRLWARWLRSFDSASAAFLLERFVRRHGTLRTTERGLRVVLEPRPLDPVLRLAGYLDPIEGASWLGGATIEFDAGAG